MCSLCHRIDQLGQICQKLVQEPDFWLLRRYAPGGLTQQLGEKHPGEPMGKLEYNDS
jgi:hypothetical protein